MKKLEPHHRWLATAWLHQGSDWFDIRIFAPNADLAESEARRDAKTNWPGYELHSLVVERVH
ncbi:MAG TPA: hypothetical protein ENI96_09940 [Sedimenticola thiotaurini]|uniref:Uncharacterized protein n=1 Tax=Sedimenticola thiotaurini TaxID=1543721 RepID=A0A831RPR7_9GAMM|nr:hypothetical protein [Sedimenticola thiotaurini]